MKHDFEPATFTGWRQPSDRAVRRGSGIARCRKCRGLIEVEGLISDHALEVVGTDDQRREFLRRCGEALLGEAGFRAEMVNECGGCPGPRKPRQD